MSTLFWTVLVASLVGSLHCAGMCGAFVAFAIGAHDASKGSRAVLLGLYQVGRLATYAVLGAVAGLLGSGVDLGGRLVGLQRAAAVGSGALMVGFGAITLLKVAGVKWKGVGVPKALTQLTSAGHARAMRYSPPVRAVVTGLLTTLLPCGWLYAFVIVAAGTGSALAGAALMGVFWVGTLPMLTFIGVGVRWVAAPLAKRLPAITAMAIVVVGVYTIVGRAQVVLPPAKVVAAQGLDETKMPCCATRKGTE